MMAFMPGSDYTLCLSVIIVTVSVHAILIPKFLSCTRNMSDHTLLPDQSSLTVFSDVLDVLNREGGTSD